MSDDITRPGADLGPDQGEMRERAVVAAVEAAGAAGPRLSTISWRDIPAQLTARAGDDQHKVLLHARFQHAIDRAAAVAGLTSTHDYVQQWRSDSSPLADGDVAAQLDQRCAEIDDDYPRDRLEALVTNGGVEPSTGDGRARSGDAADEPPTSDTSESDRP